MNQFRVSPRSKVRLGDIDPADRSLLKNKKEGEARLTELGERLDELQDLLYAGGKHSLLIVLQGMDTAGKDGVIRKVFQNIDPLGVRAVAFKAPTEEELSHDFLWRIHRHAPARGEVVIFNRSHYEDVLVVRVKSLVPARVWKARYAQINDFERTLAEAGATIVKFFLYIDRDEQKERLQARLDDPAKRWKFRRGDLDDRALWDDFIEAYEEAISKTSTEWAPWYIVPANSKWYRNVVVAQVLVDTLEALGLQPPQAVEDLTGITID
jgi:PPK2 family polyphosphate:nucleotide phosphotransferase